MGEIDTGQAVFLPREVDLALRERQASSAERVKNLAGIVGGLTECVVSFQG